MENRKSFGTSVKRKEDPKFLRGEGTYVDDIHLPNMLHAAFARSGHAHARVLSIDKSAALAVPGVHAVLVYADLPEVLQKNRLPLLVPHPSIRDVRLPYTLAQIAADQLNVDPADVNVVTGDTATISLGIETFASRTAVNAGSSVHIAAMEVATKAKAYAATMMNCTPEELEIGDHFVSRKDDPSKRLSLREVAVKAMGMPGFSLTPGLTPGLEHTAQFTVDRSTYSNGTHVVEVDVDIETGATAIVRYTVGHDCGTVINPMVVDGQVIGGVAHGIGNALLEKMVYDDNAQPVSTNFGEYMLPLSTNMPKIDPVHLETPSPLNPLGMKGAGEGSTIPAAAAIISAIEDALKPFGVVLAETPVSPQCIVGLLGDHALGTLA